MTDFHPTDSNAPDKVRDVDVVSPSALEAAIFMAANGGPDGLGERVIRNLSTLGFRITKVNSHEGDAMLAARQKGGAE